MSNVIEHINAVNEKLLLLVRQHQQLQKENNRLRQELEETKLRENEATVKADWLQQQVEIAQLSAGKAGQEIKTELEKRINAYIKEIDQCIALLVNQ